MILIILLVSWQQLAQLDFLLVFQQFIIFTNIHTYTFYCTSN